MTNQHQHEPFIRRCLELAKLGSGFVSPNPLVGAVIVHRGKIIGEGYHQKYGSHHAEVNAVNNVQEADRHLLKTSTLYVSLEPCCIYGRTPPCTDLIIREGIPNVVISAVDETPAVAGNGIKKLEDAGVKVTKGVLKKDGQTLSQFRNTFVRLNRPYIILKYAKTQEGYFGRPDESIWITSPFSKRLVHKWRSETDAILVGTRTTAVDNPKLTNRFFDGPSPIRIVIDRHGLLSHSLTVFKTPPKTILVTQGNSKTQETDFGAIWSFDFDDQLLDNLLKKLATENITSLIVEGGSYTLQQFIDKELWDEARVFSGTRYLENGIPAPKLKFAIRTQSHSLHPDRLDIYKKVIHSS